MADQRDRAQFTNYFVTVNTNMVNNRANRALAGNALRAATEELIDRLWDWARRAGDQQPFARNEEHLVDRVRARVALEHAGRRNPSPHCHTLLEIMHHTTLWADFNVMKQIIRANLAGMDAAQRAACNIDIRFVQGNDVNNVLHYMLKDGVPDEADAQEPVGDDLRAGGADDFPRRGQYDGWDRDRREQPNGEQEI